MYLIMPAKKYSVEFFQDFAKTKNGEFLSTKYDYNKLLFKCNIHNHIWTTKTTHVMSRHSWCWWCAKDSVKKHNLESCQILAKERGGVCLSEQYINCDTKMSWSCNNNHIFNMTLSSVNRGHWCPTCSTSISQRICQEYFEQLFKEKFPTKRKVKILEGLELDGYCEKLGLAFEHHGIQHYMFTKAFNMTKKII